MSEIKLSSQEISRLESNKDFEQFWFNWEISKEEIKLLWTQQREELKQILSTNKELFSLISEINASAPADQTATPPPEAQPSESDVQTAQADWDRQIPEEQISSNEEQESWREMYKIENWLRNKGYTNLYILARALEQWYIPALHTAKFKEVQFSWNKWGWIKHKGAYIVDWWPMTNWTWKLSVLNRWFEDYVKSVTLSDIALEKTELKEIIKRWNKISTLDNAMLNKHFNILVKLEAALVSWDINAIRRYMNQYKTNFTKEKCNSFEGFKSKYRINTITSWILIEDWVLAREKASLNTERIAEEARVGKFSSGNSVDNLMLNTKKLKAWDVIKMHTNSPGHYLELKIKSVSANWKNILVDYIQHKWWSVWFHWTDKTIRLESSKVVFVNNRTMPQYENLSHFEFTQSSAFAEKMAKFSEKELHLNKIKAELAKNPPELEAAVKLKKQYEAKYATKIKSADFRKDKIDALHAEKPNVEAVKKEVIEIQNSIDEMKKDLIREHDELLKSGRTDSSKVEELRKIGEKINKEIVELQKRWIDHISQLDLDGIKAVTREPVWWLKWVEKMNWWWDWFLKAIDNSKWWKILIWASLVWLVFASKDWVKNIFKQWISKETARDMGDLALGFVPIIGWVNDLYIWKEWKDWNWRELSKKESWARLWFWIVWLIPWGSLIVKGTAKVWVSVFKMWKTWMKAINAADATVEGARLAWKTATYGYLGYSLVTDLVIPTYHSLHWIKK
ncbi:MAG: hypothetical protein ACD_2C00133G0003 [uncultured bacterium (gcode 4)]|uniref:Uncharacterized protein n=1 Tax=uncultured bacterium (gcode 4) TaxID=1234023 RepID=K2G5V7_9BACT|nr:MAG: hypothetical protein ACD_2C00133G0003 [uncultured bacterium (gcode 4)]